MQTCIIISSCMHACMQLATECPQLLITACSLLPLPAPLLVCSLCCFRTAPAAQARMLKKSRDWGESGDPNGYDVLASARRFEGGPGTPKRAVTPEAAESTANNMFLGLWRRSMDKDSSVVFATVESDPNFVNPDRKPQTIMPRGRVAMDTMTSKKVDQVSGNAMANTVAMGGASVAQTFEGEQEVHLEYLFDIVQHQACTVKLAVSRYCIGCSAYRIAAQLVAKPGQYRPGCTALPKSAAEVSAGDINTQ